MDMDWIFDWDMGMGPRKRGHHRKRGPRRRFFRQGEVRMALLSLIDDEPAHGYELMKRLEERSGGMYKASAGTVYPVLQQLEDEGLIEVQEENGKKVYHVTEAGKEELKLSEEDVERIWPIRFGVRVSRGSAMSTRWPDRSRLMAVIRRNPDTISEVDWYFNTNLEIIVP